MWYMAHMLYIRLYIRLYMSPLTTAPFLFLSSLLSLLFFFPNQMLSLNHLSARWTEGATMRPILGMSMGVRRTTELQQTCSTSSNSSSAVVWPAGGSILYQCCASDGQAHAFSLPAPLAGTGKRVCVCVCEANARPTCGEGRS